MKKLFFYLLPLLAAGWLLPMVGCKKDTGPVIKPPPIIDYSKLPEATQTGANTFGCLVNGEVWVPRVPIGAVTYYPLVCYFNEKDGSGKGGITCNLVDIDEKIDTWMNFNFGTTHFNLGTYFAPDVWMQFRDTKSVRYDSEYRLTPQNMVNLTNIDTVKNIISGTFQFTVYDDTTANSKKAIISDGRFDLHYYPQ